MSVTMPIINAYKILHVRTAPSKVEIILLRVYLSFSLSWLFYFLLTEKAQDYDWF